MAGTDRRAAVTGETELLVAGDECEQRDECCEQHQPTESDTSPHERLLLPAGERMVILAGGAAKTRFCSRVVTMCDRHPGDDPGQCYSRI
jgi:hypothetical protein